MTVPDATPGREFTPSIERLRDEYVQMRAEHYGFSDLYAAEFDRSLAERDARIKAEAQRELLDEIDARVKAAMAEVNVGAPFGTLLAVVMNAYSDACRDAASRLGGQP